MSPDADPSGAATDRSRCPGAVVAVVGPSGAGKDALIAAAAATLGLNAGFFFPRRVVTRTALAGAEDHDSLTPAAFAAAEAAGAFCLTWAAHGLSYGLPVAICGRLEVGETVVANISRAALRHAAERFARLHIVEITAPRHLLVARIAARGRESPREIDQRLERQAVLEAPATAASVHRIDNDGAIGEAAAAFFAVLRQVRDSRPGARQD